MAEKLLVIAFSTQEDTKNQVILDIIPGNTTLRRVVKTNSWGSILTYTVKDRLTYTMEYKTVTKKEFEKLYGKIEYP